MIAHWRRIGVWTAQWILLRSLIHVLVHLGMAQPAAVLYGALRSSATTASVHGSDAERLAAAVATAEREIGKERLRACMAQGQRLTDDEVVAYAQVAVNHAIAALRLSHEAPGESGLQPL